MTILYLMKVLILMTSFVDLTLSFKLIIMGVGYIVDRFLLLYLNVNYVYNINPKYWMMVI